ncbi:hypothetical protein HFP71_35410 [Streptomyces sp. ARC32]
MPSTTTASETAAIRPGHSDAMASPVRITRPGARWPVSPARSRGSAICVTRHGRPVVASSPDQQTRFVSRWTTSNRR